ncbi:hypothetical protein BJN45_09515 [Azonexus hydrophilus]|uniref:Uncharacterized protein n=1 Tax=Azonexus hydrophilus TaxID=418702 RepID=A0A1R1I4M9_9RHOO|nr:flagellar filament capping protein FliD [Azonexus hydrophilus]OMG53665.1 hypothetical protein BJN45_09515 [Azonexus hydrophilus]
MSINGVNSTGFDFSTLSGIKTGQAFSTQALGGDFLSFLKERLADFKSQAMDVLLNGTSGTGGSDISSLFGKGNNTSGTFDALLANAGLSAGGRNTALFDPESAYSMMTDINRKDVLYKAEFAEMTDMKEYVAAMQQEAGKLGTIDDSSSADDIRSRLQAFADAYNGWIDRFDEVLANGGLLAGTHAATVSQWELEKSIESIFNGAGSGVRGMGALGLEIDPVTNMASIDTTRLDAVLAGNMNGAVNAIQEFSGNFAKSAELLNSEGNFIPNRMNNLARVIDYIDTNKASLQMEFGLGDTARPSGEVARALAAYQAMRGTSV